MEILNEYVKNGGYERISAAYENKDLKLYAIEVHSLKSTSKTLGFFRLAEIAEQLQFAAEKNDSDFINSAHKDMMELYKNILTATKQFLIDTTHS